MGNTRWLSGVEATQVAQGVEWDGGRAEADSPSTSSGTAEPAGARPEGADPARCLSEAEGKGERRRRGTP